MKVVGNSSIKSENFNGVSEKLKQELIKSVKQNQVIHFQLLGGSYDPVLKRDVFGSSKSIRLSDRIYDPYAKEVKDDKGNVSYEGAYVDIGVPDKIKDGRVERCKKFWVHSIANGIPGNGQFSLMAGTVSDMEVYEFLCLSNGSKINPYRDVSVEPQYEIVDVEGNRMAQKEKDFKELKAKLARFSKENPQEAAELANLIPKEKEEKKAVTA